MRLLAVLPLLFIASCRFLDFGGNDEKSWEFRSFLTQAPVIGKENPETPGYDADGNLIPSPEVYATYAFPSISAGMNVEIQPTPRVTPTIGVEVFSIKTPYIRWISTQIQGGTNLACVSLNKRWTSIFEITTGIWIGRDFGADDFAWGIGATISRF